ncbi:hypothetical protein DYB36_013181 [Aphanomyces astaci]|uniref:B box-type domain-containing protein n=1 Tax=Aphanomyces astaci TaxID=112090 RepID=A0A397A467_APHAT|nr:hypothetical protein DYB36_013181 [Aphanomyces astaci]RHY96374.1 hypothetical protein DYB31_001881 [Aphanomyces astaci]
MAFTEGSPSTNENAPSRVRVLLSPAHDGDPASPDGSASSGGAVKTAPMDGPSPGQVATVTSMNPLSKDFQRVRYLLQASLPGFVVHDDVMIWDMKNPTLHAQYEQQTAGLLEVDSWVSVEDLGPSMAQMYTYGFTSMDSTQHHGMKFTTGNIVMDNPGKTGKKQFVLCKVAAGRSLPIEREEDAAIRLPQGYHSHYLVQPPSSTERDPYYHEYIVPSSHQILPQFLVRFTYSAVESKPAPICALCEKQAASIHCPACDADLCPTCDTTVHSANKLAGRHKRSPLVTASAAGEPPVLLSLPPVPCRLHESKNVEFYCAACAIPVCVHCKMVGDHSAGDKGGHRLVSLLDAYEQSIKESAKPDPLIETRKAMIGTKLKQIRDRVMDIAANRQEVEVQVRRSMDVVLARLEEEVKAKMDLLRCEELELTRQVQQVEWADAFLASQRCQLAPVEFLAAWHLHKPLRVEQREFPVVHLASAESVKPDIQLLGRMQVVSGDGSGSHVLEGNDDDEGKRRDEEQHQVGGHVMSPKGKRIIEDVKNDLLKGGGGSRSPQKKGSLTTRAPSNPTNDKKDVWSTQLRREIGLDDATKPETNE